MNLIIPTRFKGARKSPPKTHLPGKRMSCTYAEETSQSLREFMLHFRIELSASAGRGEGAAASASPSPIGRAVRYASARNLLRLCIVKRGDLRRALRITSSYL